ncbi:MAG: hypothetical protein AAGL49_12985, partial [Pseudomonadota bacterium]
DAREIAVRSGEADVLSIAAVSASGATQIPTLDALAPQEFSLNGGVVRWALLDLEDLSFVREVLGDETRFDFVERMAGGPDGLAVERLSLKADDLFELDATAELIAPPGGDAGSDADLEGLALKSAQWLYKDRSFFTRVLADAAGDEHPDAEAFQESLAADLAILRETFESERAKSVMGAIEAFVADPDELKVVVAPEEPVLLASFAFALLLDPENAIEDFGLTLSAN